MSSEFCVIAAESAFPKIEQNAGVAFLFRLLGEYKMKREKNV
jgi:hypothetical protein